MPNTTWLRAISPGSHCGAAHMPAPTARRDCNVPLTCRPATSNAGESSSDSAVGDGECSTVVRNSPSGDQLIVGVQAQVDRVLYAAKPVIGTVRVIRAVGLIVPI